MHFIVLLGFGYICLFLVPANIRNPRWFFSVWGGMVAVVLLAFMKHKQRNGSADPLAQMFDRALLGICAFALTLSLAAWGLRLIAEKQGWNGYSHWFVLVSGCVAVPTALFIRFSH